MPLPPLGKVAWRLRLLLAAKLPDKPVKRKIRGIDMVLPRGHALPYFTRPGSPYFENMVQLARSLAEAEGSVCMLDIGANVGDSTLVVLEEVPGKAVCVEPDPVWHDYLQANVGGRENIEVEHSVLVSPDAEQTSGLAISHATAGSSIVERTSAEDGLPTITTEELIRKYPQLSDVRLVKSDTDGYDVMLVDAVSAAFTASRPVIFFEFDPRPTRVVMPEIEPNDLWPTLIERGYEQAVVWDNGGALIGVWPTSELAERSVVLDLTKEERGYGFWDVAVAHKDDPAGLAALDAAASLSPARQSG